MNSLYHKFAVTSVCTALSFTLGLHQEAKAATFYLPALEFRVEGTSSYSDVVGEKVINSGEPTFGDPTGSFFIGKIWNYKTGLIERRAFYEYNLDNLSLAPNTIDLLQKSF